MAPVLPDPEFEILLPRVQTAEHAHETGLQVALKWVGIVLGCFVAIFLIAIFFICVRSKRRQRDNRRTMMGDIMSSFTKNSPRHNPTSGPTHRANGPSISSAGRKTGYTIDRSHQHNVAFGIVHNDSTEELDMLPMSAGSGSGDGQSINKPEPVMSKISSSPNHRARGPSIDNVRGTLEVGFLPYDSNGNGYQPVAEYQTWQPHPRANASSRPNVSSASVPIRAASRAPAPAPAQTPSPWSKQRSPRDPTAMMVDHYSNQKQERPAPSLQVPELEMKSAGDF